jgi:hypothetical protein
MPLPLTARQSSPVELENCALGTCLPVQHGGRAGDEILEQARRRNGNCRLAACRLRWLARRGSIQNLNMLHLSSLKAAAFLVSRQALAEASFAMEESRPAPSRRSSPATRQPFEFVRHSPSCIPDEICIGLRHSSSRALAASTTCLCIRPAAALTQSRGPSRARRLMARVFV